MTAVIISDLSSLFIFQTIFYFHSLHFLQKYLYFLLTFSSKAPYFSFELYLVAGSMGLLFIVTASLLSFPEMKEGRGGARRGQCLIRGAHTKTETNDI